MLTQLSFDPMLLIKSVVVRFIEDRPTEITIYIHGFNKKSNDKEKFNRIQISLTHSNYISLIGLSGNLKDE
jgi:hypothetical protein